MKAMEKELWDTVEELHVAYRMLVDGFTDVEEVSTEI